MSPGGCKPAQLQCQICQQEGELRGPALIHHRQEFVACVLTLDTNPGCGVTIQSLEVCHLTLCNVVELFLKPVHFYGSRLFTDGVTCYVLFVD